MIIRVGQRGSVRYRYQVVFLIWVWNYIEYRFRSIVVVVIRQITSLYVRWQSLRRVIFEILVVWGQRRQSLYRVWLLVVSSVRVFIQLCQDIRWGSLLRVLLQMMKFRFRDVQRMVRVCFVQWSRIRVFREQKKNGECFDEKSRMVLVM